MKVVIMSRKRPKICAKASHKTFPHALVCIGEDDVEDYVKAGVREKNLLIHPAEVVGICKTRNWILRNVEEETVVIIDDDCKGFICLVGDRDYLAQKITDEASLMQILRNLEQGAKEIGTGYFGISRVGGDLRKYNPFKPFKFIGYSNSLHGIIGRGVWFDESHMLHDDIDFCLKMIRRYRVIWLDDRFCYYSMARTGAMSGGRHSFLTPERDRKERMEIKKKCGKYYHIGKWKFGEVISTIKVERQQKGLITPDKM